MVTNAKYHSSLHKVSQLDVRTALAKTNHSEVLAETTIVDSITETASTIGLEKCTKQLAQIAVSLAKYHSSLHRVSQLDVEIALARLETN